MAIKMARRVQNKLPVCKTCDNSASENTKQLVKNNNAAVLEQDSSKTETSQFRLDGLVTALGQGNSSKAGSESVSISVSKPNFHPRISTGKIVTRRYFFLFLIVHIFYSFKKSRLMSHAYVLC